MATVSDIVSAFRYYIENGGYYEKASGDARYLTRDVENFAKNKGSANYTWAGVVCGLNPAEWCAMMVSTAVYEAVGSREQAKAVMWGRWPHYNCGTLADDAMAKGCFHYSWYGLNRKGKSGAAYTPKAGDVIIFTNAWKTRDHTGMVYAVDSSNVYYYEGNGGNMARRGQRALTSAYIYGYSTPLADGAGETQVADETIAQFQKWLGFTGADVDGEYGPNTRSAALKKHQTLVGTEADGQWGPETYYATKKLGTGDSGDDVMVWQGLLCCGGFDPKGLDGSWGANTTAATEAFQEQAGLEPNGNADRYTWAKMFGEGRPQHTLLKKGAKGAEVKYLQELLVQHGFVLALTGVYDEATEDDVADFQQMQGLEADGECGELTWAAIE